MPDSTSCDALDSGEISQASFDFDLPSVITDAIVECGFTTPTPIQQQAIPALLSGRDVLGLAQTGTGKTAAFGIPALARLDYDAYPQALVLAPTRELAMQDSASISSFATKMDITIVTVYGGSPYGPQLAKLKRGAHIVVGTPGRIIDHIERGSLDLSRLKLVVLDEADEMLTMGFQQEVETILAATPDEKQMALFSATMPKSIRHLADTYLKDPIRISVKASTATPSTTNQRFVTVPHARKLEALARIIEVEDHDAMIVFCKTKASTEDLAESLVKRGFKAAAINGDMPQLARERTIEQMKKKMIDIVVATDVAARGIDIERITHVINYDIAHDGESYVHRIGRTGRAGRSGEAISFITPKEKRRLAWIEKATRQPMTEMHVPTAGEVNAHRVNSFNEQIASALQSDQIDQFIDLVQGYLEAHESDSAISVAAALAVMAHGGKPLLLDADRDDWSKKSKRAQREDSLDDWSWWRLDIGHRNRVRPAQIVGALVNEGGLNRNECGRIDIHSDYSVIQLPTDLDETVLESLKGTKIAGRLIRLRPWRRERHSDDRHPVRADKTRSEIERPKNRKARRAEKFAESGAKRRRRDDEWVPRKTKKNRSSKKYR